MHNAALASLGMGDWRYQLLPVPPALLAETVRALGDSGFVGANATIPHKRAALELADSATSTAAAIGAANTLTFSPDGTIAADNTDAAGLLAAIGEPLAGKRALVLGAGGSARAAVWALLDAGAEEVTICNRTRERADELARELGARSVQRPARADLLVNCTSVGLAPAPDELSQLGLTRERVGEYALVVDLAYRAGDTALVDAARSHGVRTLDGLEVLVAQGALSFTSWTGRAAPLEVMRQAARAAGAPPS